MLRKLVLVGLVGVTSLIANIAAADDAVAPTVAAVGISGVSFTDDQSGAPVAAPFALNFGEADQPRFANLTSTPQPGDDRPLARYEVGFVAHPTNNVDVSVSHRDGFGFNANGDIDRRSRGSEIRVGRGLLPMQRRASPNTSRWYLFAASEDQAIVWQPGVRNDFGGAGSSFALQDRVEIGDRQAGITYETHGIQTSLAYVERKIRFYAGGQRLSENENFAGITLTMRH
ncbi:MAG: hypothetical protein HY054_08825 [Proteobacteria bacterium]|nr:hypothetical protein [Pseudomonadota bacterium]